MMNVNLGILKKRRSTLRERIKADILELVKLSEGELSLFEATHGVLDTLLVEVDNRCRTYGDPATITHGLAQTWLPSTTELAEEQAQANGGPVKKVTNAVKNALFAQKYGASPSKIQGQAATYMQWDDPAPAYPSGGPQYVEAKITKNMEKWAIAQPHVYQKGTYTFVVGGLVANKTIEQYGYELPEGYEFQQWSTSESKLVKSPDPANWAAFHFCGPGGCIDGTVDKGSSYTITGQIAAAYGLKLQSMKDSLLGQSPMLQVDKVLNKDLIVISWKTDDVPFNLDDHLVNYKAEIKAQVNAPNALLQQASLYGMNQTKSAAVTKAKLEEAYNKVQVGYFNKHDPVDVPLKNSNDGVTYVPFKTWLTAQQLKDMGMWDVDIPAGWDWQTAYEPPNGPQYLLNYKGALQPVWDNF